MPPCCASAASRLGNGPSFTSAISSCAAVADQFLHARRIVHARQLHQDFVLGVRLAVLLHGRLGQPKLVDAVARWCRMARSTVSRFRSTSSVGFMFSR